jgi:putative nucleotidyltransferase with HDIG domain
LERVVSRDSVADEAFLETDVQRHLAMEHAINRVLHMSVAGATTDELIAGTLDLILSMEWLAFDGRGAVLLVDDAGHGVLRMHTSRGMSSDLTTRCAEVPFGMCLCGRAAENQRIEHASCVTDAHDVSTEEPPHGHYCVPIVLGDRTLGVINLYLRSGHERRAVEEEFLFAIADALAGSLRHRADLSRLAYSEAQLAAIVEGFDGLLYTCTRDYRIEFMNERFMGLLECVDPIGKICYETIHHRDEPCPQCANDEVFAGRIVRREIRMEQDGRYYMVLNRPVVTGAGLTSKLSMSTDITYRREAEQELERLVDELEEVLGGVVAALASTTSQRDPYTAIHQERVAKLACAIADTMGLSDSMVDGLRTAALLHDIGKISVPSEILGKPGPLSEIEMGIVRSHPSVGYELLEHVPFRQPVAQAVLQHHERMDGSGYPDGLVGDELLLEARILAVADVVEAMSSHRPYRPSLGLDAALAELREHSGTRYEPRVVDACMRLVAAGDLVL